MVDQPGELNIKAESGQALLSDVLTFEIPPELITSTTLPSTETPAPSASPTMNPTATPTETPMATPIPVDGSNQGQVDFGDWLGALILTAVISAGSYWTINIKHGLRWGVRAALLPLIGGMLTYTYLAINMPGSTSMIKSLGTWGVLLITVIGAGLGVGAVFVWQMVELRRTKPA